MSTVVRIGMALVFVCGCASSRAAAPDDVFYTRMNGATQVTVHPPAALVSQTEVTSADLPVTNVSYRDVAPGYGQPDMVLTANIRRELARDTSIQDAVMRVRVVAINGRAYITGEVATLADKVAVEQRIREVPGVTGIDDEVQVLH